MEQTWSEFDTILRQMDSIQRLKLMCLMCQPAKRIV